MATQTHQPGTLYLVATPIGNLEDITLRALRVLREVGLIAAEDTRHTRLLLARHGIGARLLSYHAHSPAARLQTILARLGRGESVALVSDAGTPGISDPGRKLVDACWQAGIQVVPVPGPSAPIAALSLSGFPAGEFAFLGFLPRGHGERVRRLHAAAAAGRALIFFEAASRLPQTLEALVEAVGDTLVLVARELTKRFEETVRGPASELAARFRQSPARGEVTVVVEGKAPPPERSELEAEEIALAKARKLMAEGLSARSAAQQVAAERGMAFRAVYRRVLQEQSRR